MRYLSAGVIITADGLNRPDGDYKHMPNDASEWKTCLGPILSLIVGKSQGV